MDIPASSGDGTGGSSGRLITRYGTTKYVPKEVSNHIYGNGPGHGTNRNQSRSRSPRHCSDRAGLNDRVDQIASSDHRTNMSPRSRNVTYKFFASGNRHYRNICWNSRSDQTSDSFINYKLDDCTQSMDSGVYIAPAREGSKGSGATLELNVPVPYWDNNEWISEQRGLRSPADDHAVCDNRYMAHSSSGVSVFEPRGTTVLGAIIEGSMILTGHQLLKLNATFRKPDVLDIVRSEASSSGQCLRSSEPISILIDILARILEVIKQLPELYAALSATSALKILQSYVSGSAGPDAPAASSTQLDLVNHSLKLINFVFNEQQAEVALSSQLPRAVGPGGVGPYGTDCGNVELSVNSLQSSKKALSADSKNEEQSILKAVEMKEESIGGQLVNNEGDGKAAEIKKNSDGKNLQTSEKAAFSDCKNQERGIVKAGVIKKGGQDRGKLVNNEGDDKADEIKNNDGKSLRAFKFSLVEFVKELMSPTWKEGQINKEAYKTVVKNVADKVIASIHSIHIPQTREKIDNYLSASKPKILKLLQAYMEKVKDEKSNID